MTITIKQHYVPQFYLKLFSKNEKIINVYDKISSKNLPVNTSIESIAQSKFFYDIPEDIANQTNVDPQLFEKIFSKIESESNYVIKDILNRLKNNAFKNFNSYEKSTLLEFIFFQYIRTKQTREEFSNIENVFETLFYSLLEKNFPLEQYPKELYPTRKIDAEDIKKYHLLYLFDFFTNPEIKLIKNRLKEYICIILENNTDKDFITSDSPVIIFPHINKNSLNTVGLLEDGVEIIFPLSSKYLLVFLEDTYFSKILSKGKVSKGKHILPINKVNIDFYNFLQIKNSERFIFSRDGDFSIISLVQNKFPEQLKKKAKNFEFSNIIDKKTNKEYLLTLYVDNDIHKGKYIGKSYFKSYLKNL